MLAFTSFAHAEDVVHIAEDYERFEIGTKPPHGASSWTGDSMGGNACYGLSVEKSDDTNHALSLSVTGTGENFTHSYILYHNMSFKNNDIQTFRMRARTDDSNGTKRIFVRGTSSAQQVQLVEFSPSGALKILGETMGRFERRRWYDIKISADKSQNKITVYIDNTKKGATYLKGYDLSQEFSMRWYVEGSAAKDVKTAVYVDNVFYTDGDTEPSFEKAEDSDYKEEEATTGYKTIKPETLIVCLESFKAYRNGEVLELSSRPLRVNTANMLPLRDISTLLGAEVGWDSSENAASVTIDGKKFIIKDGTSSVKVEGRVANAVNKAQNIGGSMYIPEEMAQMCFGKTITAARSGGIAISSEAVSEDEIKEIIMDIVYAEPTTDEIIKGYMNTSHNVHPRILLNARRAEVLRNDIKNDALIRSWYTSVKNKATASLDTATNEFVGDPEDISLNNTALLGVARNATEIINNCSFVYLMEGDERYAERAAKEMLEVASYPNWCPSNFLTTGELAQTMAMGYDWTYDYLSEERRAIIEAAIMDKGLKAAEEAYKGTAKFTSEQGAEHNRMGWIKDESNWGFVCNGGIASGALAIMNDSNKDYCAYILKEAYEGIKYPTSVFAPDGAWTEGVGYWGYAMEYMINILESSKYTLGTDFGATNTPGFSNTPFFSATHIGPKGAFNFGDAGAENSSSTAWHWFADRLGVPGLSILRINMSEGRGGLRDILLYKKSSGEASEIPKDSFFRGTDTAIFTSGFGTEGANYFAVRGKNGGSHNDLDAGSFVMDALGERWALDLGMESYSVPGYWFWPSRGDYYRKRAEGHNTIVINPDKGLDQIPYGQSKLTAFRSGEGGGYMVVDLSGSYSNKAKSVKRAVGMFDNRQRFIVQDEIHTEKPSDIWWLMQTRASINIAPDGKSAILALNDKRMLIELISTCNDAVFSYGPAEPFPTSPNPEGNSKNIGVNRLAIKSPGVTDLNMQVIFTPYINGESPTSASVPFKGIALFEEGKIIDTDAVTAAKIDMLLLNGEAVSEFDKDTKSYILEIEEGTETVLTAVSSGNVTISNGDIKAGIPTRISVTEEGLTSSEYVIGFKEKQKKLHLDNIPEIAAYTPSKVTASAVAEAENVPENTTDLNPNTKWSANGAQWIMYDLGEVKKLGYIGLLWLNSTQRSQNYSIELSTDGESFEKVFDGQSDRDISGMEYINLLSRDARYVRVNVNGTSAGAWTSLMETKIFAPENK